MNLTLVIPCYNEANRLERSEIEILSKNPNVRLFFVNDGSTDATVDLLQELSSEFDNTHYIDYRENTGKANTLYCAFHDLKDNDSAYFGFLDADFSTSAEEFLKMYDFIEKQEKYKFIFASRIATLNTEINRKPRRHYIGRIIITLLNLKYHLGIYDTQCGAKIFAKNIVEKAFEKPFETHWLFDIEIFLRLREYDLLKYGYEFPLQKWEDVAGSKLSGKESWKVLRDLNKLLLKY